MKPGALNEKVEPMKTPLLILAIAAGGALTLSPAAAQDRQMPDFATLDANGDGQISLEELTAQRTARFAEADANSDGALSPEELLAHMEAERDARADRMVERMLSRLDANDDGVLQESELAARGGDRMVQRFDRADTNADGVISAEEFEQAQDRMAERGRHGGKGRGHGDRPGRG